IVYFEVVARVSGSNAVTLTGNFDGATPATDSHNDDSVAIMTGSFNSTGLLKGNMDPTDTGPNGPTGPAAGPFGGSGSTNGTQSDWDSDGDLDIGNNGTSTTGMWSARAAAPQFATISHK